MTSAARFCCLIALFAAAPAYAQPVTTAKVRPGSLDILTPVTADQSRCVALSEKLRLLAFGHDKQFPEGNITLVKLDEKGVPASSAETIKLPLPPDLVKAGNYVSSLAFHPKLPRLYVWQEINVHYNFPTTPDPPIVAPFDHLCILDVSKSPAELMLSVCRGPDYLYGMAGGAVAVDDDGSFLYIPNLRHATDRNHWGFGRVPLDADGLPKVLEKDMPLPERLKEIASRNVAKSLLPAEKTPNEYVNAFPGNFAGSAMDVLPLGPEAVLAGGPRGFLLWRPNDQVSPLAMLPLKQHQATMIGRHPKSTALYATRPSDKSIFRADLAGDVLTSLPRETVLAEKIGSRPVAMAKKLAVAGPWHVTVFDLDDAGNLRPDAIRIPVLTAMGRTLIYSPQFDRLYVGVELSK